MVKCLGQGTDLHMAQLMPLPLTISCFSKSRLVLPFWCWTKSKRAVKWLCVCVHLLICYTLCLLLYYLTYIKVDIIYKRLKRCCCNDALQVGVLQDEYSCLGIFCAIAFFPLGLLCCLAMKQRVCPNCGAMFG